MNSTEAQLRYGKALASITDPAHPTHPMHTQYMRGLRGAAREAATREEASFLRSIENRRQEAHGSSDEHNAMMDFLNYALSLMRSHNQEHSGWLPVLDVAALKHVAYVLDAVIYYLRSIDPDSKPETDHAKDSLWNVGQEYDCDDNTEDDATEASNAADGESVNEDDATSGGTRGGSWHPFFVRSDSTTFLGCLPPDPVSTPLAEALPLAEKPHLLQPSASREQLFGTPQQPVAASYDPSSAHSTSVSVDTQYLEVLPTQMSLSIRKQSQFADEDMEQDRDAEATQGTSAGPSLASAAGATTTTESSSGPSGMIKIRV